MFGEYVSIGGMPSIDELRTKHSGVMAEQKEEERLFYKNFDTRFCEEFSKSTSGENGYTLSFLRRVHVDFKRTVFFDLSKDGERIGRALIDLELTTGLKPLVMVKVSIRGVMDKKMLSEEESKLFISSNYQDIGRAWHYLGTRYINELVEELQD